MKKWICRAALLVAALLVPVAGLQARDKKEKAEPTVTTGAQDRALWVGWLWKIAYPVVHNLAEGTLRKNMPVESGGGNSAGWYAEVAHLEAVGRVGRGARGGGGAAGGRGALAGAAGRRLGGGPPAPADAPGGAQGTEERRRP